MSWNKRSQKCSFCTKSLIWETFVHKCVYIPVSKHFSFSKIIHPFYRCGISRSWLNSMIITQLHLVLGTIKDHSKLYSFVTQHNATDVLKERAIGMLTARKCHVNFSTISHLQRSFREFGSTSNLPHNRRPCVNMTVQPAGFFMHRADRNKHLSGKKRGGGGMPYDKRDVVWS